MKPEQNTGLMPQVWLCKAATSLELAETDAALARSPAADSAATACTASTFAQSGISIENAATATDPIGGGSHCHVTSGIVTKGENAADGAAAYVDPSRMDRFFRSNKKLLITHSYSDHLLSPYDAYRVYDSMVRTGRYQSSDLLEMNYAAIARSVGRRGVRVIDAELIGPKLSKHVASPEGLTVVDVVVTRDPAGMLPAVDSRTIRLKAGDRIA